MGRHGALGSAGRSNAGLRDLQEPPGLPASSWAKPNRQGMGLNRVLPPNSMKSRADLVDLHCYSLPDLQHRGVFPLHFLLSRFPVATADLGISRFSALVLAKVGSPPTVARHETIQHIRQSELTCEVRSFNGIAQHAFQFRICHFNIERRK